MNNVEHHSTIFSVDKSEKEILFAINYRINEEEFTSCSFEEDNKTKVVPEEIYDTKYIKGIKHIVYKFLEKQDRKYLFLGTRFLLCLNEKIYFFILDEIKDGNEHAEYVNTCGGATTRIVTSKAPTTYVITLIKSRVLKFEIFKNEKELKNNTQDSVILNEKSESITLYKLKEECVRIKESRDKKIYKDLELKYDAFDVYLKEKYQKIEDEKMKKSMVKS